MMHQLEKPLTHEPQLHPVDKTTAPIGAMSQVGPIERRNRQQRADWMRAAILRCGPFTVLDEEALEDLIKVSSPAKFARRGLLYEQGSVADSIYVVASGRVRVVRAAGESRTLTVAYRVAGELLGETALPTAAAIAQPPPRPNRSRPCGCRCNRCNGCSPTTRPSPSACSG